MPNDASSRRPHEEVVAPATYAAHLIEEHLPGPTASTSLAEMFREWDAEDATDDPSEIAQEC